MLLAIFNSSDCFSHSRIRRNTLHDRFYVIDTHIWIGNLRLFLSKLCPYFLFSFSITFFANFAVVFLQCWKGSKFICILICKRHLANLIKSISWFPVREKISKFFTSNLSVCFFKARVLWLTHCPSYLFLKTNLHVHVPGVPQFRVLSCYEIEKCYGKA